MIPEMLHAKWNIRGIYIVYCIGVHQRYKLFPALQLWYKTCNVYEMTLH